MEETSIVIPNQDIIFNSHDEDIGGNVHNDRDGDDIACVTNDSQTAKVFSDSEEIFPIVPNGTSIFCVEKEFNSFEIWLKEKRNTESAFCKMHMKAISISWYHLEMMNGNLAAYLQKVKECDCKRTFEKKCTAFSLLNQFWEEEKGKLLWKDF